VFILKVGVVNIECRIVLEDLFSAGLEDFQDVLWLVVSH